MSPNINKRKIIWVPIFCGVLIAQSISIPMSISCGVGVEQALVKGLLTFGICFVGLVIFVNSLLWFLKKKLNKSSLKLNFVSHKKLIAKLLNPNSPKSATEERNRTRSWGRNRILEKRITKYYRSAKNCTCYIPCMQR